MDEEQLLDCPYCGEPTAIDLASAADDEVLVVDCSVCCNPMTIHIIAQGDERWAEVKD